MGWWFYTCVQQFDWKYPKLNWEKIHKVRRQMFFCLLGRCISSQVFNFAGSLYSFQISGIYKFPALWARKHGDNKARATFSSLVFVMYIFNKGWMFLHLCSALHEKELKTKHSSSKIRTWGCLFNVLVMRKTLVENASFYIWSLLRQHYFGILEILLNFSTWAGKFFEPQHESPPKVYFLIANEESFTPEPNSVLLWHSWWITWKIWPRSHSYSQINRR